jgi:hypothetical protein
MDRDTKKTKKSYRLISLVNIDAENFKNISIAERCGCILGMQGSFNTHRLINVIHYINRMNGKKL